MKIRKYAFFSITLLPLAFLVALAVNSAYGIYVINRMDSGQIFNELEAHLARKQGESFPLPGNIFQPMNRGKTIFVFGESSVILSDKKTFSQYLEENHPGIRVVNLGVSGIDSFSVKRRVNEALGVAKPDLIVLYYGHNDYNNAYQGFIIPRHFEHFDFLLHVMHFVGSRGDYSLYGRMHLGRVILFFERIGLLKIQSRNFSPINRLIARHYILNNEAIMRMAARHGIPTVLITPVGNLRAEPFGDLDTKTLYWHGMRESHYPQAIEDLSVARDSEITTFDLRAKSMITDYIRTLHAPLIYSFDLEKALKAKGFEFGFNDFTDYFHLRDQTHKLLADMIYGFIIDKGLLRH